MSAPGLRRYARTMLADNRLALAPSLDGVQSTADWTEATLHTAGEYQTQLIVLRPGTHVPRHRHLRCDSLDVALCGNGQVQIGAYAAGFGAGRRGPLAANLVHVPRGEWHGGEVGHAGMVFLSFQHWIGPPGFISDDWEALQ